MHRLTVHIDISIPDEIEPDTLEVDLKEAINDLFVMDGYEDSEVHDIEV